MENKIEKTPANNYDNNIFDKKEKNGNGFMITVTNIETFSDH